MWQKTALFFVHKIVLDMCQPAQNKQSMNPVWHIGDNVKGGAILL